LRRYNTEPQVWDGKPGCNHEWQAAFPPPTKNAIQGNTETLKNPRLAGGSQSSSSFFCSLCGAWLGELGLEPTFDLYLRHLCDIFDEVRRVLKKEGTCWVNIADTYAGSWGGYAHTKGNENLSWKRRAHDNPFLRPPSSLKQAARPKSLCLIPFRFAIEMCARGWLLRNTIIWHKPNCMPQSVKDRFTVDFEYVFFFVKSKKYFFRPQREVLKPSTVDRYRYPSGQDSISADIYPRKHRQRIKQWKPNLVGRNRRCVWTIGTVSGRQHRAVFPERLIEPMVEAGCPPGGIVLDPFLGSGTTALVARRLGRRFLGIELNAEFAALSKQRLKPFLGQEMLSSYLRPHTD
jgi:site-specific DNA-methyltransferase (adenine-specific)